MTDEQHVFDAGPDSIQPCYGPCGIEELRAQLTALRLEQEDLRDRMRDISKLAKVLSLEDVLAHPVGSQMQERLRLFQAIATLRVELLTVKSEPGLVQRVCETAANNLVRAERAEASLAQMREALETILKSAFPNEREHPTMWKAWRHAEAVLHGRDPETTTQKEKGDLRS